MSTLDVHISEGFLPMVDGSLVYHRGFGDRRTTRGDARLCVIDYLQSV